MFWPDDADFEGWVDRLGDPVRVQRAYWHLVLSGPEALPAIRIGLRSDDSAVRRYCTRALDHLVDETSFPILIEMLADREPTVRVEAIHALACDRCKETGCRPSPTEVLDRAIDLLLHDRDTHVRANACELVGRWVHSHVAAVEALIQSNEQDPSPAVRKKAGWYAPGGTIFRKTAPAVSQ
jgi:hypothetical protein